MQLFGKAGDAPCIAESANLPSLGQFTLFFGDGSIPQGYMCRSQDGVFCDQANFPTGGCVPLKGLGEKCDGGAQCSTGFCSSGVCSQPVAVGGNCWGTECVEEGFCKDLATTGTPMPVCIARAPVGSACTTGDECLTGNCDKNGVCSPVTDSQRLVVGLLCL
jgi:hypothetical protein